MTGHYAHRGAVLSPLFGDVFAASSFWTWRVVAKQLTAMLRRKYFVEVSGRVELIIDNVPHANEPPLRRRSSSISLDHGSLPIPGVSPPISLK
jgi:hypothetical protein